MTNFIGIIIFIAGFILGAAVIWFIRQREQQNLGDRADQLENAFGKLSREALDANQKTFLELAKSQFEGLLKSSDGQLDEKKKLIDSSVKEMKTQLETIER